MSGNNNRSDNLISTNLSSVANATDAFGEDGTLIVARPARYCNPIYFTVPEGYYALVTRFGAEVNKDDSPVWPSGIHFKGPWFKISHLVTKQSFIFNTSISECKTKDNVSCAIDIALIMRIRGEDPSIHEGDDPMYVRKFIHEVTAHGLAQQIRDAEAEAVRKLTRSVYHTEVFGLRSVSGAELASTIHPVISGVDGPEVPLGSAVPVPLPSDESYDHGSPVVGDARHNNEETSDDIHQFERADLVGEHDEVDKLEAAFATERGSNVTDAMRARLNAQFMPQGIEILDVIIEKIKLPQYIQQQMTKKTLVISQNAEQRMQHKFKMQQLNQKEEETTLLQTHGERKKEAIEEGNEMALSKQNELNLNRAEGRKAIADIQAENEINKGMIYANGSYDVKLVGLKSEMEVDRIKLEAESKSEKDKTEADFNAKSIESKSELESTNLIATGDKLVYNAHGKVAPMIRTLNNHLTKKLKLEVSSCLASNSNVIITGTHGGDAANKMILADAALGDHTNPKISRSDMISEIAVASGKAKVRLVTS